TVYEACFLVAMVVGGYEMLDFFKIVWYIDNKPMLTYDVSQRPTQYPEARSQGRTSQPRKKACHV
ncbi:MAG: hypothetical protein Q4A34_02875, partial [Candidatus Saccharibacteria bacterium]|nr:hypothetical protein [Candidatus Saccharibacteria bacterium]